MAHPPSILHSHTRHFRITLIAAETLLWLYAFLLLFNTLCHPTSRDTYLRTEDISFAPHRILSETFLRHEPENLATWLSIPPPWIVGYRYLIPDWQDQPVFGGGPMTNFSEQISKINTPRVLLRFFTTTLVSTLLIATLRIARSRLPHPKGFEVLPTSA